MKIIHATALLAVYLLLISCASSYRMYPGRVLPNNAVAILEQPGRGPAVVTSVDGKPYDGGLTYYGVGKNRWELLPGVHRVEVNLQALYGEMRTTGPQTVTFTAEAGYVYDVDYDDKFVGRTGVFSEAFTWKPAIRMRHPVTGADRIKASKK